MQQLPTSQQPIGNPVSRPWYTWFQQVNLAINAGSAASGETNADVTLIAKALGSESGLPKDIPSPLFDFGSGGSIAAVRNGSNAWFISLQGDAQTPGTTHYYGTNDLGEKGWFPVFDALAHTADITLDLGVDDGITTIGLADLADSGTGALLAVTRDTKGRVSGTKSATITGTTGRVTVANGNASAGLPTIDLAMVTDAGGGTLLRFVHDAWGRITGTSAATTDDLTEGTRLYYTDTRADARIAAFQATFASLPNAVDDTAAAAAGVAVGGMYRNGSTLQVRIA